ncbi:2-C-methyl-D-erythritol 4-phosphate cytidylyltransferase [Mycobacterium barrassiae]|uniref:IspD/TarI family cytidylyltransferase n=1 Tax=Mycobacterium barrassiae TaxID=319709 RepID=UPI0022659294|nr:IspD/TarI family cytidylyltransferase [Mycobacterium barrassiae]MCV7299365.1 2-C-methyl-D-erythritol 4-phosphate cytidylyltransferase [Mycobacterium barrassiae]
MSAPHESNAVAVVLAAGLGTRVGADGNKAYLPIGGRSMVTWSIDTLTRVPEIARIVLVYRRGERELAQDTLRRELPSATVEFVEGGDSRHGSEFNVLQYLAADIEAGAVDVVAIHDAARPVAGADMFVTALSLARDAGGAIPAISLDDVLRTRAEDDLQPVTEPGALVRVQTPQAFRAAALLEAYRAAAREGFEGTDTSSCVEAFTDVKVRTFRGELRNLKVTYAADVAVAERLLMRREGQAPCSR